MTGFRLAVFLAMGVACRAGCLPVRASRIYGRDLARADARFGALPATLAVGFAAAPGAKRVFLPTELRRIAKANGLEVASPGEVCFEIPMRRLGEAEVAAAMRKALPEGAEIQIAELPATDVPEGEIGFSMDQIEPAVAGANGVQVWRGFVQYAEARRAPVWARVRVSVRIESVIAVKDLAADVPIAAASLRMEIRQGAPQRTAPRTRIEDIAGRAPKHAIHTGAAITRADVVDAPAVKAGDSVRVEVRSGLAQLGFDAVAQGPAHMGEVIELRNPANGRSFKARLESPSRAVVIVGGGDKL